MINKIRTFVIDYLCSYCPHDYHGKSVKHHEFTVKTYTVGEAVIRAEGDGYIIKKEYILGVRERNMESV